MDRLGLGFAAALLCASPAAAADAQYLCAYQDGDRASILRVTVSATEVGWVKGGNAHFSAMIIDNAGDRIVAASAARLMTFTADLFLLDLGQDGRRSAFTWSRASVDGQSSLLRGECGRASR